MDYEKDYKSLFIKTSTCAALTYRRGNKGLSGRYDQWGNAKRNLLGNYHKIKGKYLQLYLNEFVYKLNRRYFEEKLFDRLIIAGITGL